MKFKCDHKGCDFVAEHPTIYAKALLGRHKAKEHGYISPTAKYNKPKQPRDSESSESAPAVRPYNRKPANQTVKFCPECGCDLHVVAVALRLRR